MPPKKGTAPAKAAPIPEGPPSRPIAFVEWTLLPSPVPPPIPEADANKKKGNQEAVASALNIGGGDDGTIDDDFAPLTSNTEPRLIGRLEIELMTDLVPRACENFKHFCVGVTVQGDKKNKGETKQLGYKDTRLVRATSDILQCGDVSHRADGRGNDSSLGGGAVFEDETLGAISHETRGILSYANSGPNTNGSQFFITLNNNESNRYLDQHHLSFGRILQNEDNERTLALLEEIVAEIQEGAAKSDDDQEVAENRPNEGPQAFGFYDRVNGRFNPAECPIVISACGMTDQTIVIPAKQ